MRPAFRTLLILLALSPGMLAGCRDTADKAVVEPVAATVGQRDKAALEAALANARALRQALLLHTAGSKGGLYPTSMDVLGYDGLREVLPDAGFPADLKDLQWDPSVGLIYSSDGHFFEARVRAATLAGEMIVITPEGVRVE